VYSAGRFVPQGWIDDTLVAEGRGEKAATDHPWRQTLGPFRSLVAMLAKPAALVVDPFVGQGTTGVAAVMEGRRFLGADLDAGCVSLATERLEGLAEEPA